MAQPRLPSTPRGDLSLAPHRDDTSLSNKFRTARCGEIALGQQRRIWVSWTTPTAESEIAGWIAVGLAIWDALRRAGHQPIEVYPYGVFRTLAGTTPPKKTTLLGASARRRLLADLVELPFGTAMWSHDGIDAIAAALVARWSRDGRATASGHDGIHCDGSAIWLPIDRIETAAR